MGRMDVQAEVRRVLAREFSAIAVRVSAPHPLPDELITVSRYGGAMRDCLLDEAGVEIQVWAQTEAKAAELAHKVSSVMLRLPFLDGFADVQENTLFSDWDLVEKRPRWYASYTITTFNYDKES